MSTTGNIAKLGTTHSNIQTQTAQSSPSHTVAARHKFQLCYEEVVFFQRTRGHSLKTRKLAIGNIVLPVF